MRQTDVSGENGGKLRFLFLFCTLCLLCNVLGARTVILARWPLYLDTAGTMLAAVLCGYLPGIAVGLLTNVIENLYEPGAAYYAALSTLTALAAYWFERKGWFRRFPGWALYAALCALICGVCGSLLSWCLYGFDFGDQATSPLARFFSESAGGFRFFSQLSASFLLNLADKALTVLVVLLVLRLLPANFQERFPASLRPVPGETRSRWGRCRVMSLRTKVLLLLGCAAMAVAVTAIAISLLLYHQSTIEEHIKLGQGIASLAAATIDPDQVDAYIEQGGAVEGYTETEAQLYAIRDSSPDIQYIYVYQIRPDGCHVVFDLDTEELEGSEPGELIPFDESFAQYLPALLAGESIEPVISDDTYGWLLTIYQPVYDSLGICRCYAAADISMGQLRLNEYGFLARVISLFLGFFILIFAFGLWAADYNVIQPVNTMASAAGAFAFDTQEARADSEERFRALSIHTGDEIENLYRAFSKTSEETLRYIADVQHKTQTITEMQNGLIMVLADIVESRDQNTGDHVRKTAAYAKIIIDQMRREGIYADTLTDEFEDEVVHAAPLHDIGKIHVPDAVLNKPGRLTEEEFQEMKQHTLAGKSIIEQAIASVPESGYLDEVRNLAAYHHERWDGKGYPYGISGEEIPLSARIMAVADVFDALVSRRSYKEGFPFAKAMDIIREGSGSHFDPKVAEAFLHAEDEVRRVAESFGEGGLKNALLSGTAAET